MALLMTKSSLLSPTFTVACFCCRSVQSNLQQYVENKYVTESTGFKALPEIINGRAAMLGECVANAAPADADAADEQLLVSAQAWQCMLCIAAPDATP